jgi:hypothetical protein
MKLKMVVYDFWATARRNRCFHVFVAMGDFGTLGGGRQNGPFLLDADTSEQFWACASVLSACAAMVETISHGSCRNHRDFYVKPLWLSQTCFSTATVRLKVPHWSKWCPMSECHCRPDFALGHILLCRSFGPIRCPRVCGILVTSWPISSWTWRHNELCILLHPVLLLVEFSCRLDDKPRQPPLGCQPLWCGNP